MNELSIFHFSEPFCFNLPVIITQSRIFIVDTYMGPKSIEKVINFSSKKTEGRKVYIVNTHSHFDHIWGNSAFREKDIIGHTRCMEIIKSEGEKTLEQISITNPEWINEKIDIIAPNITFEDEMVFYDDNSTVKIKYLPGHTIDSSIIIIKPENILLAGDMVEYPFPLLEGVAIKTYLENLRYLEKMNFSKVIPSHGKRQDPELISDNITYLQGLEDNIKELIEKGIEINEKSIPLDKLIKPQKVTDFYLDGHKNNITKIITEM